MFTARLPFTRPIDLGGVTGSPNIWSFAVVQVLSAPAWKIRTETLRAWSAITRCALPPRG